MNVLSSRRQTSPRPGRQAERSLRPTDKEWMKLAQRGDEPVVGVIGALSRIHAVK
jgi:hypothetical protein